MIRQGVCLSQSIREVDPGQFRGQTSKSSLADAGQRERGGAEAVARLPIQISGPDEVGNKNDEQENGTQAAADNPWRLRNRQIPLCFRTRPVGMPVMSCAGALARVTALLVDRHLVRVTPQLVKPPVQNTPDMALPRR